MRTVVKVARDLWFTKGRTLFMMIALAAGLTSMGGTLAIRTVVEHEMNRSYLETRPASATFDVGEEGLSDEMLQALLGQASVVAAERRARRVARWRANAQAPWGRATLFIIGDFIENSSKQGLAKLGHEEGARVPAPGEVLIERSALGVLGKKVGDRIQLTTDGAHVVELKIVGVVHEPALAPASSEQAGYFFGPPETLALLGETTVLDEIRVLFADDPLNLDSVLRQVNEIAIWFAEAGVTLHEVRVPPPGEHPHQKPSQGVLLLLSIFSVLTFLLAGVLCASLMSITMARQAREVAVMKTLGATRAQIAGIYALMLLVVSAGALMISALPTWGLSWLGIHAIADLLNFDLQDGRPPLWVLGLQIALGLTLPLLTAAPAIIRASRASVREALDNHGARLPSAKFERLLRSFGGPSTKAAVRNTLRVPKRLLLTLSLLAAGGGLFIASISMASSWEAMTASLFDTRHYDLEVHLTAEPSDPLLANLRTSLGTSGRAEVWGFAPANMVSETGLPLSRAYPDGGHGSFSLVAGPDKTKLVDFDLQAGRWLRPGEMDAVVINQFAAARFPKSSIGDQIELVVEGRRAAWNIVGLIHEVAAPANAYVSMRAFKERALQRPRSLRLVVAAPASTSLSTSKQGAELQSIAEQAIEKQASKLGAGIVQTISLPMLVNAMGEHVVVLIRTLLALALLLALVGVLALGSTMMTSVVERTRELAVLQAIGARPVEVTKMVVLEGMFVSLASLLPALFLALPLTAWIGNVVGELSFGLPLPFQLSLTAFALWSFGVMVVSALSSFAAARHATQRTVSERLGHV